MPNDITDWKDDETYSEFKTRKHAERGLQGMGQKNVKNKDNWTPKQKMGLNNKNKGRRKQNIARKKLGIPDTKFRSQMGHEENWRGEIRAEVKAGKQVQPLWNKYLKAKEQSDHNTRIGDSRPFIYIAMPDGTTNGLICFELDKLDEVIQAFIETWHKADNQ
tara:strand:+ start:14915 stop:15400 length:486 start_codon:yes stop_codon:yes gene_type:complete